MVYIYSIAYEWSNMGIIYILFTFEIKDAPSELNKVNLNEI